MYLTRGVFGGSWSGGGGRCGGSRGCTIWGLRMPSSCMETYKESLIIKTLLQILERIIFYPLSMITGIMVNSIDIDLEGTEKS